MHGPGYGNISNLKTSIGLVTTPIIYVKYDCFGVVVLESETFYVEHAKRW